MPPTADEALQRARELLATWDPEPAAPEPARLDFRLGAGELLPAVESLTGAHWGYLICITGLDLGPEAGELEALYHFASGPAVITLRVQTPRAAPSLPSICALLPSASLYERELIEMFGFEVENTPDRARLFTPEDWPDGVYPLRKDFDPAQAPIPSGADARTVTAAGAPAGIPADVSLRPVPGREGRFVIPIGPQHPALKEPGHFEFSVDGEVVTAATVRLGYVHRGIEKAVEERNWTQSLYLLERVCGICSHTHALAYSLGVEQLAGVQAPPRAQAIRELVAGLERIHSHLLWLGVAAHEAGFDTLFMFSWRDRETVMDVLEHLTGNRVNYSANVLGGVKWDIDAAQARRIREGMDFLEQRARHYLDIVTQDMAFLQRTRGIGTTTAEQALWLGLVGPAARASGLARDIRVEAPYGPYHTYPVNLVVEQAGDLEAKFVVRIKELFVSITAIRTILDHLPGGPLVERMPRRIPAGETVSRVEAPRGELFYFIKSGGGDHAERIKIRTPSMCNFASVIYLVIGHQLADVPMILSGIDPCFSCNDRTVVLRRDGENPQVWSWDRLCRYAREVHRT